METSREINKFYQKRFSRFGQSRRAVGWASKEKQELRFNTLIKNFQKKHLQEESIVDFGCGLSHFLIWLQEQSIEANYLGVEIVKDFLKENKKNFPDYEFLTTSSFLQTNRKYGYIIANGVFTLSWGKNHRKKVKEMIRRLYRKSKYGFSFTMLNSYYPWKKENYYHFDPFKIGKFCYSLTDKINIDISYLPEDFTITLK